jgi:hypothetical protein
MVEEETGAPVVEESRLLDFDDDVAVAHGVFVDTEGAPVEEPAGVVGCNLSSD